MSVDPNTRNLYIHPLSVLLFGFFARIEAGDPGPDTNAPALAGGWLFIFQPEDSKRLLRQTVYETPVSNKRDTFDI